MKKYYLFLVFFIYNNFSSEVQRRNRGRCAFFCGKIRALLRERALRKQTIVSRDAKSYINVSHDCILNFLNNFPTENESKFKSFQKTLRAGYYWFSLVKNPPKVPKLLSSEQEEFLLGAYEQCCVEEFYNQFPYFIPDLNKYKIHLAVKTEYLSECLIELRRDILNKEKEYKQCVSIFKVIKNNAWFEKYTSETQRTMATIVFYPHCKDGAAQGLLNLLVNLFKNNLEKYARGDFLDHNFAVKERFNQETCLFWAGGSGDLKPGGIIMRSRVPKTDQDYNYLNHFVKKFFEEELTNQYPKIRGQKDLEFNLK